MKTQNGRKPTIVDLRLSVRMISLERCITKQIPCLERLFTPLFHSFSTAQSLDSLSNDVILEKLKKKEVSVHKLESLLSDPVRALNLRRNFLFNESAEEQFKEIPANGWDSTSFFSRVAVIHNVIVDL